MSATFLPAVRAADLIGDAARTRPVYQGLAERLRHLIADGRIPVGTRMPSERELAPAVGVSRTTVTHAYDVLKEGGYLLSRQGSGTMAAIPANSAGNGHRALIPADPVAGQIDLTCAVTRAPDGVMAAYEAAIRELPRYLDSTGYEAHGLLELRETIAARYTARGLPTTAQEVMITNGAMAGLQVVTRMALRPGDRVAVESAAYPNTLELLRAHRARLVPLPMEAQGWQLEDAASILAAQRPHLAILVPDFHNPTGALLSSAGRATLAAALATAQTLPVIDETIVDIDLERSTPMPEPFAVHHRDTVTVGSAAKSHWGGQRLGWIRASAEIISRLVQASMSTGPGVPVLEQLVLNHLMSIEPGISQQRRTDLLAAREATIRALQDLAPQITFLVPRGGLSLWLELPSNLAGTAVALATQDHGLLLASGPRFAATGGLENRIRLPYVLSPELMVEAVRRLALAMQDLGRRPQPALRRAPAATIVA